jgi:hypothetical protein
MFFYRRHKISSVAAPKLCIDLDSRLVAFLSPLSYSLGNLANGLPLAVKGAIKHTPLPLPVSVTRIQPWQALTSSMRS